MENSKTIRILDAATKVFAENGYQYATISQIAKEAGISTGLVYSYFTNKLDLLLSIILSYVQRLNLLNREELESAIEPMDRLQAVLSNLQNLLINNENALYMVKVSNEALPHLVMIKEKELQEKRYEIILQYHELRETIDQILLSGQNEGVFDNSLKPSVVRHALMGALERLVNGLFITTINKEEGVGYNADDVRKAVMRMVERFIC